jgi:hypothetical protein
MSRYVEIPGVRINAERLPPALRGLLPLAQQWCLTGDDELSRELDSRPIEELKEFVMACEERQADLEEFCLRAEHGIPTPHEVALMQVMHRNFLGARSRLWLRRSRQ